MNNILAVFSILSTSLMVMGITLNITQTLKDYFIEVENKFCPIKDNDCMPNSNTSNNSSWTIPPYIETDKMCCEQCSCDENFCDVIESCCVETLGIYTRVTTNSRMACQYPQLKPFVDSEIYPNAEFHYKMFTQCPDINEESIAVVHKCDKAESFDDITTKIPVTDTKTMLIYKNQYCARCYNASDKDLYHWDANIMCIQSTIRPRTISTAIRDILDAKKCNLIYLQPKSIGYDGRHDCKMIISSCNVTGLWRSYDPDIEVGCAAYKTIFNSRYKNIFCYLCNSNDTDGPISCERIITPNVFVDFTAILKGPRETKSISAIQPDEKCSINQLYDPIKDVCRMIECLFPKTAEKGSCVNLVDKMGGVVYGIFIRFTPYKLTNINTTSDADGLALQLLDFLKYWFDSRVDPYFRSFYIYIKYWPVNDGIEKTLKYFVAYVQVEFDLLFPVSTDVIDHMLAISEYFNSADNYLQNVTGLRYKAEIDRHNITYTNSVVQIIDNDNESLHLLSYDEGLLRNFPKTMLTVHHTCPLVRLNSKEYDIKKHYDTVFIKELDGSLDAKNLLILNDHKGEDGFTVLMCVDLFKEISSNHTVNTTHVGPKASCKFETNSISALLSIVCSSSSICFSVVTAIVYFSFTELKTQPVINNIILCLTLVLAQTLFQFGSGQSCNVSKAVCQGIGVLVHFSWLFLIFWMNCCCIHMFRVFRLGRMRIVVFNKLKTTFMYIIYSLSASLAIILITVIMSLTNSNGTEIGYGGTLCYIKSVQMIAFSFILPVGIIISINIILFLVVMLQIQNTRIKNENDKNFLHIYVKLSTLTGFTWIFGFLSFFLNVDVFDYIFIILNASQGMFLFFAFVANRQTLHFC